MPERNLKPNKNSSNQRIHAPHDPSSRARQTHASARPTRPAGSASGANRPARGEGAGTRPARNEHAASNGARRPTRPTQGTRPASGTRPSQTNGSRPASGTRPAQVGGVRPVAASSTTRAIVPASATRTQNHAPASNGGQSAASYSRETASYSRKQAKGGKAKFVVASVLIVLLVLVGAGAAFGFFVKSVDERLSGGKTAEEELAIQDALVGHDNFDEPFYMLLLGSDARLEDASMGARSDTSIVVRVDPITNTATLISIPRDTKIYIDGSGPYKFNAAYAFNGVPGAIRAASELLGVDISHYAEVNFESLTALVDVVGGVEIDVPYRIDDYKAGDVVIEPGLQTLDGEAALVFSRTRQFTDGDFTRTSNQRVLIEAIIDSVLNLPANKLPSVIQEAAGCVSTDMEALDLFSLALAFTDEPQQPGSTVDNAGETAPEGTANDNAGEGAPDAEGAAPETGADEGAPASSKTYTVYSVMVPSTTADIDGISYVITDEAGLKAVMEVVEAGGDPHTVETYGATDSAYRDND